MRKTILKEIIRLEIREVWEGRITEWIDAATIGPISGLSYAISLVSQGLIEEGMRQADLATNPPSTKRTMFHQFRCVVSSEIIYGDPSYP